MVSINIISKQKLLVFILLLFALSNLKSQDRVVLGLKNEAAIVIKKDEGDSIKLTWKKGGTFNLNVNQASSNNWAAGGDEFSLSVNAFLNVFAYYLHDRHSWDNAIDLAIGVVQSTSLGRRKSSDRLDFTSKYGYSLNKKLNLASLLNVRSQMAKGYKYTKNSVGVDTPTLISNSFNPTLIILSEGFDIKPRKNISIYFSPITSKWVLVTEPSLRPLYGVNANSAVRSELGAFFSGNYTGKIGDKFTYKTKLDLFSNYKTEPQNVDVYWTHGFYAKITRYINFSFNVEMIYDNDTKNITPGKGPAPQWLQLMGIGFAYDFGYRKKIKNSKN